MQGNLVLHKFHLIALEGVEHWRVKFFGIHILAGNREVNQEQIEVLEIEILKSPHERRPNMFLSFVGAPQLRGHKQILALDDALIDGLLYALTGFHFVLVNWSLIYQAVASLDCIVNAILRLFLRN